MKKALVLLGVICFLPGIITAKKIPGYYISLNNDTVWVRFTLPRAAVGPSLVWMQRKVRFIDQAGVERILKPTQAKGFFFIHKQDSVRMVSFKMPSFLTTYPDTIFLRKFSEGRLKLYHYYFNSVEAPVGVAASGGEVLMMDHIWDWNRCVILQKDEAEPRNFPGILFKKEMTEYLSDCEVVFQKVLNGTYLLENLEGIIREYNLKCGNN